MATDISDELRWLVAERAGHRCEYCLLHEEDSYSPHQIDHIISRKHGGQSTVENLAYACLRCNAWKGAGKTGLRHFRLQGFIIEPLTT